MTPQEKLQTLEILWDDICKESSTLPSPEWHDEVLKSRAQRVQDGKATYQPLDEAKQALRDRLK